MVETSNKNALFRELCMNNIWEFNLSLITEIIFKVYSLQPSSQNQISGRKEAKGDTGNPYQV